MGLNLRIHLKSIPHSKQRYDTCGDWWWKTSHQLEVRVSELGDEDMEMAIAIHEIDEALACRQLGISESDVDAFDKCWKGDGEPGDDPQAPYHRPHVAASIGERAVAHCLGISWNEYTKAVDAL